MEVPEKIFTVLEYVDLLNTAFKGRQDRIQGEVSQCKFAVSGHVYFTIKDTTGNGVLDCVIWKGIYAMCGVKLEVGMEVIITGHPNVYGPTGRLSIVADAIELVGEGALKKAYDELRKKLEIEGLFDAARKRTLPELANKIGVITSREGAVIHDFLNNLGKFGFTVTLVDSRVEGQTATRDLIAAVRTMRREAEVGNVEALVVIRGGGSLESLQAFNNEALVREIVKFPVPVLAGIGHDQDVPLLALAADYMASTPTATAHILNHSWEEAYAKLNRAGQIYVRIEEELKRLRADLDLSWTAVLDQTTGGIKWVRERLDNAERSIRVNDPTRQLKLGYAIVRRHGKIIRSVRDVRFGEKLETQVSDGTIQSQVNQL